jgi:hypothetical protein
VKDFEKTTDPTDAPHGVIKPRGHSSAEGPKAARHDPNPASHSHADTAALSAPELTHPANAAPLAGLLTQLQQSHGNVHVQRVVADMNEAKVDGQSRTPASGEGLDAGVMTQMESAFADNFGDVRIHADSQAERTTDEVDARAVTRGRDIYFGKGEYNPATRAGKELLAHELTHVIQQRGSSSSSQQADSIGEVGDVFEQEADQAAAAFVLGQQVRVATRGATPTSQRTPRGAQRIQDYGINEVHADASMWTYGYDDLSVHLLFSSVPGATVDTVHLTVPSGVAVSAVDLTGMSLQVRDPGGTHRRLILMIANRQVRGPRLIQVTFVKGSQVYVVTFQLPVTATAPAAAPARPAPSGPPPPDPGFAR